LIADRALDQPQHRAALRPAPFGPIVLSGGLGQGPTLLAAFDAALLDAGVANYNLICLSSVIPPGSHIERRRWHTPAEHWGQRLNCVLSQMREDRPGHTAHAGIGWVRDASTGAGLFVELHDHDPDRLDALCARVYPAGVGHEFQRQPALPHGADVAHRIEKVSGDAHRQEASCQHTQQLAHEDLLLPKKTR